MKKTYVKPELDYLIMETSEVIASFEVSNNHQTDYLGDWGGFTE